MSLRVPNWIREILASEQADVAYLLDANLRIADCSPSWEKFAEANGGVGISRAQVQGRYIFDFIPKVLTRFYEDRFSEALRTGRWVGFDYQCSTPDRFRLFHMAIHSVENSGLLVVNANIQAQLTTPPVVSPTAEESTYEDAAGTIIMCAHCRKTRRSRGPERWDWVPQFLRSADRKFVHGLCPDCVAYLYHEVDLVTR